MTFPSFDELLDQSLDDSAMEETISGLSEAIGDGSFQHWYTSREFARNIRNGQSYFNKPGGQSPPLRHSASQLLKCHRKIYYGDRNAPKESAAPAGIFWIGSNVETELIVPYFQAISPDDVFVQNSKWVDFEIRSDAGDLRFKGETDPVFVDAEATPILLTEIKTRASVDNLSTPTESHKSQAHCYMYGLSQAEHPNITDALIVYIDRSTLDLKSFHIEFDPVFWRRRVLAWCAKQSQFRIDDYLPPAEPEHHWECQYCSYRKRCGQDTSSDVTDSPPIGLVPLHEYPREKVTKYVESRSESELKLTPTVGHQFPDLADKYDVYNWMCESCSEEFRFDKLEPTEVGERLPCQACGSDSEPEPSVRGPTPQEQEEMLNA